MDYIELSCQLEPFTQVFADLLIAELGEIGYDSFTQDLGDIKAYILEDQFDLDAVKKLDTIASEQFGTVTLSHSKVKTENWNAVWESNFDPVQAGDKCIVRAPFHELDKEFEYEIIIEPKMSFGTGHHQTTQLILEELIETDLVGKSAVDCGCGTGVLGILAEMRGASEVYAFDNDQWAYENTVENAERNGCSKFTAECGTLELLEGKKFDIVIANINRNILIEGMQYIAGSVRQGGTVLFSGLFTEDVPILQKSAEAFDLSFSTSKSKDNWACAIFTK